MKTKPPIELFCTGHNVIVSLNIPQRLLLLILWIFCSLPAIGFTDNSDVP
jgi:hypothetical protein